MIQIRNKTYIAYLALGFGILCIGFSAIFVKFAGVPGPVSAFYRIFIAGIVVVPWRLLRKTPWPARSDIRLIFIGGVFFAIDLALWNAGILLTSAAVATLLANSAPLWVGAASYLFFREKLSGGYWLGLFTALTGMSFLMGVEVWQQLHFNTGELLAVAAGVFYAGYLIATQRVRARVDTLTFMALSIVSSLLVLWPLNILMGTSLTGFSSSTWAALLGMGLLSHLGGWLAINFALGHLRAASVSVSLLGQVLVTALVSMPLLGEFLGLHQIGGGILVLTGIYLVNRRRRVPEK